MNMYRNFNKIRQGIFHFMMGRMVMVGSAILVSLMLIRGLSIAEFAVYVTLLGLMLVMSMLSDAGISRIQPRFLPELYIQKNLQGLVLLSRSLTALRFGIHGVFLLILWLVTDWFSIAQSQVNTQLLLVFGLFAFFYALNQQTQRTMQVLLLQKVAAKITVLEWLFKLIPLAYLYDGPDSLLLFEILFIQGVAVAVAFVVGQVVLWGKSRQLLGDEEPQEDKALPLSSILHFAWKNWLQSLLGMPMSPGAVRMLMAAVAGSASVAYLGFAYTMMQLLQRILPSKMIVQAIEPVFIARYRETGDFQALNNMVSLVLKLNYFVLMPIMVWFALGSHAVLDWVSAGKYADSGWIIATLIFIFMFENHRMALQVLSNAVDQSILLVKSNMLAVLLLPLYVLASMYWQLYGLLFGLMVISWARNWYLVKYLRKQGFDYQQDWRNLLKMFALALLSSVCVYLLLYQITGLLASVLSAIICMLIFYGLGLKVKFFKTQERALINKTIGKKVFRW